MTQTQQMMNMLLPAGDHVSAKDIAVVNGFSPETIRLAIKNGKIAGFEMNATPNRSAGAMQRKMIPRYSAVLYLAETFTGDVETMLSDLMSVIDRLPPKSLLQLQAHIAKLLRDR
jgi:hypothetical protein